MTTAEFELMALKQQAAAWNAVCTALDATAPGWNAQVTASYQELAVKAIFKLSEGNQRAIAIGKLF